MSALTMIPGPEGKIEAMHHCHDPRRLSSFVVLISSPHPTQEGLMDHPVLYTMYRAFSRFPFDVLRFNYRGSGKSNGRFTNGDGEIADAEACLDWLGDMYPPRTQYWVAGYSFGAWITLQTLMRRPECSRFVCVSPRANLYSFDFLAPCPTPGLMVHGKVDSITPCEVTLRLANHLSLQKRGHRIGLYVIDKADQTFSKALPDLEDKISRYIAQELRGHAEEALKAAGGDPSSRTEGRSPIIQDLEK